jgi:phage terminase small subunit
MTPKQKKFVQEYLIDLNATQAAIRAGYGKAGAHTEGNRMLSHPEIKAAIEEAQRDLAARTKVTQEEVIRDLREIRDRCMQHVQVLDRKGNPTGDYTFDATGAIRAVELLGKHIGMFKEGPTVAIQNNVGSVRKIVRQIVYPDGRVEEEGAPLEGEIVSAREIPRRIEEERPRLSPPPLRLTDQDEEERKSTHSYANVR